MKKLTILILFAVLTLSVKSQEDSITSKYIEISIGNDGGCFRINDGNKYQKLRDNEGKKIVNIIDAMNYLDAKGYELKHTYVCSINITGTHLTYVYYIFERREEININK